MPSRFLFVIDAADDMLGGMSRHYRFVGQEIARRGHTVDYLFLDQMPPPLAGRLQGFSLDICRRAYTAVTRHVRAHGRPDAVYWGVNSAFPFTSLNRMSGARVPVIGMTFGVEERWWPVIAGEAGKEGAPSFPAYQHVTRAIRKHALKWATVHCDRMVCVSSEDRDFLIARHGLDPSRVSMIPVGVAPEFLTPPSPDRDGTRLLFVGTWIWRKGIRYLVDAMHEIWRERPDCRLSLVGTLQPVESVLQWWPPEYHDRLRVIPQAIGGELVREYATHDIFVLPSIFEGMPLSLAEAMAARLAVITTATCGMRDLVTDGVDGLLVPMRDAGALAAAIAGLLDAPLRQRQLGDAAGRRIAGQTWDRIADQFLDVFACA